MIKPSKKSCIYPSVSEELKRKIEQGKPRNKLLMKTKKRGGITNAPSASHIPTINQSYGITRNKNKTTSDPPKKIHQKATGRWYDRGYGYTKNKSKSFCT